LPAGCFDVKAAGPETPKNADQCADELTDGAKAGMENAAGAFLNRR